MSDTTLSPSVVTDLPDYSPGSTAYITADGFALGGTIRFTVSILEAGADGIFGTADDFIHTSTSWWVTDGAGGDSDGLADGAVGTSHLIVDAYADKTLLLTAEPITAGDDGLLGTADDVATGASASHVFTDVGPEPLISIDKVTGDGPGGALVDGDGLTIPEGTAITWTYTVTSLLAQGNITNVRVKDDNGTPGNTADDFFATFVSGDTNNNNALDPGEIWTFVAFGVAEVGQYNNIGTVTGLGGGIDFVTDFDPSSYFGTPVDEPAPAITLVKTVDGPDAGATFSDGETINEGTSPTVTYKYVLTNTSAQAAVDPLTITDLVDDNGTPANPADDFALVLGGVVQNGVTLVKSGGDQDDLVEDGETWTFTVERQVGPLNEGESVVNKAVVTAKDDEGTEATGQDDATVTAANVAPAITLVKTVDGPDADATFLDGETINEGTSPTVTYKYVLTNTSAQAAVDPLTITDLVDDNGTPANPAEDFALVLGGVVQNGVTLVKSGGDQDDLLEDGETWTFKVERQVGPLNEGESVVNKAVVTAKDDEGNEATDTDDASVTTEDATPKITVVKDVDANKDGQFHDAERVSDGKQCVTYRYTITADSGNAATDPITITDVTDDKLGDLSDEALAAFKALPGNAGATAIVLDPGESFTFTVKTYVELNAGGEYGGEDGKSGGEYGWFGGEYGKSGGEHGGEKGDRCDDDKEPKPLINTVVVTGHDDEGNEVTDDDTATILPDDGKPIISVDKLVDANADGKFNDCETVYAGEHTVTYKYTIAASWKNASTDPVNITSITDDRLDAAGNTALAAAALAAYNLKFGSDPAGIVLEKGESFTFTFSKQLTLVYGKHGDDPHVNVVTVVGHDDEGTSTNIAKDDAKILVKPKFECDDNEAHSAGFWASHKEAWNNRTYYKEWNNLVDKDLRALDILPDKCNGVLLGDKNGNGVKDSGELTLLVDLEIAQQLISSSSSATDARQMLMKQALAAQLNIYNGVEDPQDLVGEAVKWLTGKAPFQYSDGSTGNVDKNGDGKVNSADYNTSTKAFLLDANGANSGTALTTNLKAWQLFVDVDDTANNVHASGEGLKNALEAFNLGQLITSADGAQVAWNVNGTPTNIHANTTDAFWDVLADANIKGIAG